jgi:hypothetical protein
MHGLHTQCNALGTKSVHIKKDQARTETRKGKPNLFRIKGLEIACTSQDPNANNQSINTIYLLVGPKAETPW